MENQTKTNIHIVDSVKGGSGKSTFSAKLCYSLLSQDKKACVVDLDLLGTSWDHLYGNTIQAITYEKHQKRVYLNDLVKDYEYYKKTLYIYKLNFEQSESTSTSNSTEKKSKEDTTNSSENEAKKDTINDTSKEAETKKSAYLLPAIFANPKQEEKNVYKINDKSHTADVSYSFFLNVVLKLLDDLTNLGYTDIILDMPPNSDPYADIVLRECLKTDFKFQTTLYMVSSLNTAHIKSTFIWYSNHINSNTSQHPVTKNDFAKIKNCEHFLSNPQDFPRIQQEEKDKHKTQIQKWLEETKVKFFIVFNDILNRTSSLSDDEDTKNTRKSIVDLDRSDTKKKLAYYFIDFDDKYSSCTDGLSRKGLIEKIELGNYFDSNKFYLYYML